MGTGIRTIFILAREGTLGPPPLFSRATRGDDSPERSFRATPAWSSHHQILCTASWLSLHGRDLGRNPDHGQQIAFTSSLMLSQGAASRRTGRTVPSPSRRLKTASLGGVPRPAVCLHRPRSGHRLKIRGRCSRRLARDRRDLHP
jgi:hypothetical protein